MACFLVPLGEAVVLTVAKKLAFKKNADSVIKARLGNLEKMLYGGSFLLAIEHVYHGEVIFYPPFLSAMKTPEDTREMLHEMATVGVSMAIVVTAVWGILSIVEAKISKQKERSCKKILRDIGKMLLGTVLMFTVDFLFAALA